MLLEFTVENYKSFSEKAVFSMVKGDKPRQKNLEHSILKQKIGRKTYKALPTSVVYGANAAGKTTLISAMDTFRAIVLRGNLENDYGSNNKNLAATRLELIPNLSHAEPQPTAFTIKFIVNDWLVEYHLTIQLEKFGEVNEDERKIIKEKLFINNYKVFTKGQMSEIFHLGGTHQVDVFSRYLLEKFKDLDDLEEDVNTRAIDLGMTFVFQKQKEIFLTKGSKNILTTDVIDAIRDWFKNQFITIHSSHTFQHKPKTTSNSNINELLKEALREFGIDNAMDYVANEQVGESDRLMSMLPHMKMILPSEAFESYGTVRFAHLFPLLVEALQRGAVLILDEFDASIHPKVIMNIINLFHDDDINVNKAQLIFNTHNPIFLHKNLFMKEEIKFVERDEETQHSTLYTMAECEPSDDDYMHNYFINRYGTIKSINFYDVFEQAVRKKGATDRGK